MIFDSLDRLMDVVFPIVLFVFSIFAVFYIVEFVLSRRKQASARAEYEKRAAEYEIIQKADREMKAENLQVQKEILSQLKEIKQLLETGAKNVHSR